MKIIKREPLFEQIEKALIRAYAHIPAELEKEKRKNVSTGTGELLSKRLK